MDNDSKTCLQEAGITQRHRRDGPDSLKQRQEEVTRLLLRASPFKNRQSLEAVCAREEQKALLLLPLWIVTTTTTGACQPPPGREQHLGVSLQRIKRARQIHQAAHAPQRRPAIAAAAAAAVATAAAAAAIATAAACMMRGKVAVGLLC